MGLSLYGVQILTVSAPVTAGGQLSDPHFEKGAIRKQINHGIIGVHRPPLKC